MTPDNLLQLGFSETEALVYTSLLTIGPCFVAPLIQATRKHRQIVYSALETLEKKRLVSSSVKQGKRFYIVNEPERLLTDAQHNVLIAKTVVKSVQSKLKNGREQVEVFTGPDAYKDALADFRSKGEQTKEYVVIGGQPKQWHEYIRDYFPEHVEHLRRLKHQGIDICILFFQSERAAAQKYIAPHANDPYTIKISNTTPRLPHTSWLSGDHIYMLTPSTDPLVIHVRSKALAEEYRKYFSELWRGARRL